MILYTPFRIVIRTDRITRIIFWLKNVVGIGVAPFIFMRETDLITIKGKWSVQTTEDRLLRHESIHIIQQYEMLIIGMWLWYGFEWLIRSIQYKSFQKGYINISFEREARSKERTLNYLRTRPRWAFIRYVLSGNKE